MKERPPIPTVGPQAKRFRDRSKIRPLHLFRARNILPLILLAVCALALLNALLLFAQGTVDSGSRLRALALLEVAANGRARLVPIAIKVEDKFYDAGLYRADPYPMSLTRGTVYEATRAGESVGLFTVSNDQQTQGVWVGLGQWRLNSVVEKEKSETKKAEARSKPAEEDERPILRRPKAEAQNSNPETPPPASSPSTPPQNTSGTSGGNSSGTPNSTEKKETPSSASDSEATWHPILRRGKPATSAANDELPPEITERPGAVRSTPGAASASATGAASGAVEVLTAVSDAGGPSPRPYLMQLKPEERARYELSARQMAYAAIQKFAATHPQHKPAPIANFADVQLRIYDAHTNNEPDLVLSASLPESLPRGATSAFRYFVTFVGRVDMYGDMHSLLGEVTDNSHLDAYPRMELIDVVDAEGTGRGELLFRRISDTGYDYALYRIGLDKLWPLFEGAGQNF